MDSRQYTQPPHGHAPDPLELYWLSASLPDGLYMLPPDAAGQGERAAETILVASIAIAVGLLVMIIALVAVVA
jgi:hypothetical protein